MAAMTGDRKLERYSWAKQGDKGKLEMVNVGSLNVDHNYQRGVVSEVNTLVIARDFRWDAFGTLVVMRRKDGSMWVVDGQQRLSAVMRRGDIDEVPCIVFHSDGQEHEAQAFVSLNIARRPVSAIDKFRARVVAGQNPESDIATWLRSIGKYVATDGTSVNSCSFPAELVAAWEADEHGAREALLLTSEMDQNASPSVSVFKGIFYCISNGVNVRAEMDKIRSRGGRAAFLHELRMLKIETGMQASNRLCGMAIVRVINFRRRSGRVTLGARDIA